MLAYNTSCRKDRYVIFYQLPSLEPAHNIHVALPVNSVIHKSWRGRPKAISTRLKAARTVGLVYKR